MQLSLVVFHPEEFIGNTYQNGIFVKNDIVDLITSSCDVTFFKYLPTTTIYSCFK
ncbi:hypothetical protein NUACC26_079450 [Scytonema sp. NUACC26]